MSFEGWKRGAQLATRVPYLVKGSWQLGQTLKGAEIDYSTDPEKRTLALLPGQFADHANYAELLSVLGTTHKVLKIADLPEGLSAIVSRAGLEERAHQLLNVIAQQPEGSKVDVIGHSAGGNAAAYAKAIGWMHHHVNNKIGKVITLSAPLNGSVGLSQLPGLSRYCKSIADLHPESEVMNYLRSQGTGSVDERFVTLRDELLTREEMDFHSGKEHLLDHGHFNYMLGKKAVRAATIEQIVFVLLKG